MTSFAISAHDNTLHPTEKPQSPLNANKNNLLGRIIKDPMRTPLPPAPWYQTEKVMNAVGVAFIVLGSLTAAINIAAIVAGSLGALAGGASLAVAASYGLAASVSAIAAGIFLYNRSYWNDQAFVDRMAEKIQQMSFDEIISTFGWSRLEKRQLISPKKLADKFIAKVETAKMDYLSACQLFKDKIEKYKFIEWQHLRPLLMREISAHKMDIETFRNRYDNQPLKEGVITVDDPWYKNTLLDGIHGQSYAFIKDNFQQEIQNQYLTKEMLREEIFSQYALGSVEDFLVKQGGQANFWLIFTDNIMEINEVAADLNRQVQDIPVSQIVEKFGWEVFKTNMLLGYSFRNKFLKEEHTKPFSQVLNEFGGMQTGWNILNYNIVAPHHLKANALEEIRQKKMPFEEILSSFSIKIFTRGIIGGEDLEVRTAFIDLVKRTPFSALWDTYGEFLTSCHILPEHAPIFIKDLVQKKQEADKKCETEILEHQKNYDEAVAYAHIQKTRELAHIQQRLEEANTALSQENDRFAQEQEKLQQVVSKHKEALKRMLESSKSPKAEAEGKLRTELSEAEAALQKSQQDHLSTMERLNRQLQMEETACDFSRRMATINHEESICHFQQMKNSHNQASTDIKNAVYKVMNAQFLTYCTTSLGIS